MPRPRVNAVEQGAGASGAGGVGLVDRAGVLRRVTELGPLIHSDPGEGVIAVTGDIAKA